MTIRLYLHPLSSFCWKVMIAFHEADIPYEPVMVDLMDPVKRADYLKLSPFAKIPVLVDGDRVVNETSIMIEYLTIRFPSAAKLLPRDPAEALKVRALDRFFDLYLNLPLGRIAGDRLRPEAQRDPEGIAAVMNDIRTAVSIVEKDMAARTWAAGETFTMADCAAAPSLFYVNRLVPYASGYPNTERYLERLQKRPSVARAIADAEPYFHMAPY
ncbi:MAG TPA: glutathione S-transferase family protein [Hyphomonadaceae bacterium]|jgi:glutathione S-transferase